MALDKEDKLTKAVLRLEQALAAYHESKKNNDLPFMTVCKAMEILVEYAWRELKKRVEQDGLFAPSPKEAVRQAATLGLINDPDRWIEAILARNDSVHDYFSVPEPIYISYAEDLLGRVRTLLTKL
jgi:nucleotidyltransferase substrate binding protein (TIGR01987 family)